MNSTSSGVPRTAAETQARVRAGLARRYRAERRFRAYGLAAVALGIAFVVFLFGTVLSQGLSVLRQAYVQIEVFYDPETIDPAGGRDPDDLMVADYQALVRAALREVTLQHEEYLALLAGVDRSLKAGEEWLQTPDFDQRTTLDLSSLDKQYYELVAQRSLLATTYAKDSRELVSVRERIA